MNKTRQITKLWIVPVLAAEIILCCLMPMGVKGKNASAESNSTAGTDSTSTSTLPVYTISNLTISDTYTEHYAISARFYHVIGATTTISSVSWSVSMPESDNSLLDMAVAAALPSSLTDTATYTAPQITISENFPNGYYCIEIDWSFANIWYEVAEKQSIKDEIYLTYIGGKNGVPYSNVADVQVCWYENYSDTDKGGSYSIGSFLNPNNN